MSEEHNIIFWLCFFPQGKAFEKTAQKVKQKKRWENKNKKVVFIGIGVVAGLVILGLIIFSCVG